MGSIQSLSLSDLMNPIHSFLSMASLLPIPSELSLAYLATFIAETLATSISPFFVLVFEQGKLYKGKGILKACLQNKCQKNDLDKVPADSCPESTAIESKPIELNQIIRELSGL